MAWKFTRLLKLMNYVDKTKNRALQHFSAEQDEVTHLPSMKGYDSVYKAAKYLHIALSVDNISQAWSTSSSNPNAPYLTIWAACVSETETQNHRFAEIWLMVWSLWDKRTHEEVSMPP